jgi:NAD(P)H-hydrate epimerase
MRLVSVEEMRALEQSAMSHGLTEDQLMERAGRGMAAVIRQNFPDVREASFFLGKGSNGADGLVVARELASVGWKVHLHFAHPSESLGKTVLVKLQQLRAAHPLVEPRFPGNTVEMPGKRGLLIDALVGIGLNRPITEELASFIENLNNSRRSRDFRTVALDCPSGLPFPIEGAAMECDMTITVGAMKDFLVREDFAYWVGHLQGVNVFPLQDNGDKDSAQFVEDFRGWLPRRPSDAYKTQFGRVVIIGGAPGYLGAVLMAAEAALRSGAGLVSIIVSPETFQAAQSQASWECMVFSWSDETAVTNLINNASILVVGPGLGQGEASGAWVRRLFSGKGCPLLLDADALHWLALDLAAFRRINRAVILTPHPGEMKRLVKGEVGPVDRARVAREFCEKFNCTLVLKGCRTIIAAQNQPLYFNTNGNAGLATGGSGDTLCGIIAALVAQGLTPLRAARLGVWLHGRAADYARNIHGCEEGLLPRDVVQFLGTAIKDVRAG